MSRRLGDREVSVARLKFVEESFDYIIRRKYNHSCIHIITFVIDYLAVAAKILQGFDQDDVVSSFLKLPRGVASCRSSADDTYFLLKVGRGKAKDADQGDED
jgi:hypothetical protein